MAENSASKNASAAILWLIKERIAPINATILFAGTLAGIVDLFLDRAAVWLTGCAVVLFSCALCLLLMSRLSEDIWRQFLQRALLSRATDRRRRAFGPAIMYLVLSSFVCGSVAVASEKNHNKGGAVAAAFPSIHLILHQLDIVHEDSLRSQAMMKAMKREVSDNPRKELANQGISWNSNQFNEAMAAGDLPSVKLFLQGGMQTGAAQLLMVFASGNSNLQALVADFPDRFRTSECSDVLSRLDYQMVSMATPSQKNLIHALCSTDQARHVIVEQIDAIRVRVGERDALRTRLQHWKEQPGKCVSDVLQGHGPVLNMRTSFDLEMYLRNGDMDVARELAQARCSSLDDQIKDMAADDTGKRMAVTETLLTWL